MLQLIEKTIGLLNEKNVLLAQVKTSVDKGVSGRHKDPAHSCAVVCCSKMLEQGGKWELNPTHPSVCQGVELSLPGGSAIYSWKGAPSSKAYFCRVDLLFIHPEVTSVLIAGALIADSCQQHPYVSSTQA